MGLNFYIARLPLRETAAHARIFKIVQRSGKVRSYK